MFWDFEVDLTGLDEMLLNHILKIQSKVKLPSVSTFNKGKDSNDHREPKSTNDV